MAQANDSSPETPAPETSTHRAQSELGRRGEELAAAYLQQAGYRLVAANFSVPVGQNRRGAVVNVEIDLIAYDETTLCFIEVKTRTSDWFALPSVSVGLRKQRQITRGARAYRRIFGLTNARYRYDVVSIVWPPGEEGGGVAEIELMRNFWNEEKFRKRHWQERYWD